MRILVTGAAGFIGSHLSERLLDEGHEVIGVDAFVPAYPREHKDSNLAHLRTCDSFSFVEADLRDATLEPLVQDADVIVHMAAMAGAASWERFADYVSCNLIATHRLLEAVVATGDAQRRRFVQISTSSVYGIQAVGSESTPLLPSNPYGVTKLAAEQLAFAFQRAHGVPTIALRYFSIYGPRQRPDMAYYRFIDSMLRGEPITVFGDGEQTRGNTFIDDCVRGTVAAISGGRSGESYNIGGGQPISLNRAIEIIESAIGVSAKRIELPSRTGDQRHTLADTSKAREEFGYEPTVAPEDGLPRQVEWQRMSLKAT